MHSRDWVTHITTGTLPTEEGSPHVLHYEIHRRFRYCSGSGNTSINLDETNEIQQGRPQQSQSAEQPCIQDFQRSAKTEQGKEGTGGLTALFLHGGPGAGCFPNHVRFFSPLLYETVVLLDQRGCGRSTPRGRVEENTLELLVEDVERLRVHLLENSEEDRVEKEDAQIFTSLSTSSISSASSMRSWDVILGGSWGCTLALAYAHAYPNHVRAMVLRGICLFRPREIDWLFGDPPSPPPSPSKTSNLRSLLAGDGFGNRRGGIDSDSRTTSSVSSTTATASTIFPREWEEFCKGSNIGNIDTTVVSSLTSTYERDKMADWEGVQREETKNRRTILHRYYQLLLGSDPLTRFNATRSWIRWEMGIYSSGFHGTKQVRENFSNNNGNFSVLVWNPHASSWAYEDARVWNNQSVVPISNWNPPSSSSTRVLAENDIPGLTQSLRRFSPYPMQIAKVVPSLASSEPIPIRSTSRNSGISLNEPPSKSSGNSTSNQTAAQSTVPAQAMLTCYYSTNDEYCLGRYRSFLTLESTPTTMPLSKRYSSNLPPLMPQYSYQPESSSMPSKTSAPATTPTFPLPPTIAIQGANDAICPPDTALDLHEAWNQMELRIVMNGGHSMYDPVVAGEIIKALDRFGHELKRECD